MDHLTAMTWNVLADAWTHPAYFPDANRALLHPSVRNQMIADTLQAVVIAHGVDIVGLQEVQQPVASRIGRTLGDDWDVSHRRARGEDVGTIIATRRHLRLRSTLPGPSIDGRLVHTGLVTVAGNDVRLLVTHMHGCDLSRPVVAHPGAPQATLAVGLARDGRPAVLMADTNDLPGGQVRRILRDGGFVDAGCPGPTSRFGGKEVRALDVTLGRGLTPVETFRVGDPAAGPLPSAAMPSDHVPVITRFMAPGA